MRRVRVTENVCPENVTVKQAGKVLTAPKSISRYSNAFLGARTTGPTIWRVVLACAMISGQDLIVHKVREVNMLLTCTVINSFSF